MKAYIVTFAIAWTMFTAMILAAAFLSMGLTFFITWSIPTSIAYLFLLRLAVVFSFIITLFYMPSKQGKEALEVMKRAI